VGYAYGLTLIKLSFFPFYRYIVAIVTNYTFTTSDWQ